MERESQRRATYKYREKLKQKGYNQRIFWLTDEQNACVKVFVDLIKNVDDLDKLKGIDVSDDKLSFKLVFDDNA